MFAKEHVEIGKYIIPQSMTSLYIYITLSLYKICIYIYMHVQHPYIYMLLCVYIYNDIILCVHVGIKA